MSIRSFFTAIAQVAACISFPYAAGAQCDGWQQRVKYSMSIDLDATSHRFTGDATLVYTNNSPDTLREVFCPDGRCSAVHAQRWGKRVETADARDARK